MHIFYTPVCDNTRVEYGTENFISKVKSILLTYICLYCHALVSVQECC